MDNLPKGLKAIFWYCVLVTVLGLVMLIAIPPAGASVHTKHCAAACPEGTPQSNNLIVRETYTLSSNDVTKFADWVAYAVTVGSIGPTEERVWKADPYLRETEGLEPEDLKGMNKAFGYDRGHMANIASVSGTGFAHETNYLSNIMPQSANLNQGAWLELEKAERWLTRMTHGTTFVLTGPLYTHPVEDLPQANESHMVPSGFWKIIIANVEGTLRVSAFMFDQDTPRKSYICDHRVSYRTLEMLTNLRLVFVQTGGETPICR